MSGADAVAVVAGPGGLGQTGCGGPSLVLLAGDGVVQDECEFKYGLGRGDVGVVHLGTQSAGPVEGSQGAGLSGEGGDLDGEGGRALVEPGQVLLSEGDLLSGPVGAGEA